MTGLIFPFADYSSNHQAQWEQKTYRLDAAVLMPSDSLLPCLHDFESIILG